MGKNTQYFDWGHIEWIYEPDPVSSKNNMSIGITTILPNTKQNKHIHYGDEQFIYVLSGEGIQLIGSKISEMKPKQIYHMEAGTIHETTNNSDRDGYYFPGSRTSDINSKKQRQLNPGSARKD